MEFLWTQESELPRFPTLSGDLSTDVLIIGGGMAGILCAKHLQEAGVDYVLVEGKSIGQSITKGTTAVLTAQHDTLYQDMIARFGQERARLYLEANTKAVEKFRQLAKAYPCDWEEKPSLMYDREDWLKMEREAKAVQSLGMEATFVTDTPLPFSVAGAVRFPHMAQFHPLKFLYGIARDLRIFEHTFVEEVHGTVATTKKGTITAKKIIIATHYPF